MNKTNKYLALIVLTIICGAFLNWIFCCKTSTNKSSPIVKETKPIITAKTADFKGISIIDNLGSFSFTHADHFNFPHSSVNFITPISQNIDAGLQQLKLYLTNNTEKNIAITGYYKSNEEYKGAFPNLGLARATEVKNYLVDKGIPAKQLDIHSKLNEDLTLSENNIYKGPLTFDFKTGTSNLEEELAALKLKIQAEPLILYFKTGESNIQLSAIQKQKIVDISRYLDKTSNKSAIITGHTDSVGNVVRNTQLGQKRAEFAKEFLIKNGITASKIITKSKGPLEPIADNNSKEGRSKNRRTVITIN